MPEDLLLHRIIAHRSAPDVYDPPTLDDLMRRVQDDADYIDALLTELARAKERIAYLEQDNA